MKSLIVGLDIGLSANDLCALSDSGEVIEAHRRFANSRSGSTALAGWLADHLQAGSFDQLVIGGEGTGLQWFHPFWSLQQSPDLAAHEVHLYLVNARAVARFKTALNEQEKTDVKDAQAIAEWLRFGRLPHALHLDEHFLALQRLTRHRYHLMHSLAREKVYTRQVALYLKMSTYQAGHPFSDPFAQSGLAVLTDYATLDELATRDLGPLVAELRQASQNHLPDPQSSAERLQALARDAYPLPPALTEPVNLLLAQAWEHITFLQRQLAALDTAIAALAETLPGYAHLRSVPGLGPVYAAGLFAEIQDVQRFMVDPKGKARTPYQGQAALARFAGLWWPRSQSSAFEAEDRRLAKTGSHYLRYYLVEAANSVRLLLPDYDAFYHRKAREAVRYHHRRALVLTARKLVRLVFSLLLNDQDYQPKGGHPTP